MDAGETPVTLTARAIQTLQNEKRRNQGKPTVRSKGPAYDTPLTKLLSNCIISHRKYQLLRKTATFCNVNCIAMFIRATEQRVAILILREKRE